MCRALKFEEEPNYKAMIGLFENCMARNNFDGKVLDYTWKQNRLSKDKEALKAKMLGVINRRPKNKDKEQEGEQNAGGAGANAPAQQSYGQANRAGAAAK